MKFIAFILFICIHEITSTKLPFTIFPKNENIEVLIDNSNAENLNPRDLNPYFETYAKMDYGNLNSFISNGVASFSRTLFNNSQMFNPYSTDYGQVKWNTPFWSNDSNQYINSQPNRYLYPNTSITWQETGTHTPSYYANQSKPHSRVRKENSTVVKTGDSQKIKNELIIFPENGNDGYTSISIGAPGINIGGSSKNGKGSNLSLYSKGNDGYAIISNGAPGKINIPSGSSKNGKVYYRF